MAEPDMDTILPFLAKQLFLVILFATLACNGYAQDISSHTIQFVTVDKNVKLEVLDWGGSGRSIVLLSGMGSTAHVFDNFANKLISNYHVYGITRRGFGTSSAPAPKTENYSADRLGDDVLEVCAALGLVRPVLIGSSIAGEELSSIGSRHSEKVAALIYLDAVYSYSYFTGPPSVRDLGQNLLARKRFFDGPNVLGEPEGKSPSSLPAALFSTSPGEQAILDGQQKYTDIRGPILAFFPVPHDLSKRKDLEDAGALAAAEAEDTRSMEALVKAFKAGVPQARVILMPNASHFVFVSNEADVLREMHAFLERLP
jgi:non-heme chloroperoxidase